MNKAEKERQLREKSYQIWEQQGRPEGKDKENWLTAEQAFGRNYRVSRLPVFREQLPADAAREIGLKLYVEVCSTWRMLTDVRFKLLGAVPAVTGAALYGVFTPGITGWVRGLACVAGFAVTLGLYVYNKRNDALYDDLISRGRRIEHELGVCTGLFRGRKEPHLVLVRHGVATGLIYGTALLAWLAAAGYPLLDPLKALILPGPPPVSDPGIGEPIVQWFYRLFQ